MREATKEKKGSLIFLKERLGLNTKGFGGIYTCRTELLVVAPSFLSVQPP